MDFSGIAQHFLSMTTTLDPRMAAILFLICAVGEFGLITFPYILEGIWVLLGYQLGAGSLSPLHLVGLWVAAQFGRQVGTNSLFQLTRLGAAPIVKLFQWLRLTRFLPKGVSADTLAQKINLYSPFSVACGRFMGLGIPLTLTLAVKKKRRVLMIGVLISSLIWDAVYLALGFAGGSIATIKPLYMFLASLGLVTLVYVTTFLVKRLVKKLRPPKLVAGGDEG